MYFIHVTATTVIYTSLHTLSLHYARPISPSSGSDGCPRSRSRRPPSRSRARYDRSPPCRGRKSRTRLPPASGTPCRCRARRSEEHTSELQSLMRISYAVFCLQTKIITTIHYTSSDLLHHNNNNTI